MQRTLPTLTLCFALASSLAAPSAFGQATAAPAKPPTPAIKLPPQPPDVAAPKMDAATGQPSAPFMTKHEAFLKVAREGKAQVVFLGDSITAGWGGNGKAAWDAAFGRWTPANFGIGGDRTQHVLWRIENGELDGLKPKAAVLMIGTNNVSADPAAGIAKGIERIIQTIRQKLPETKVLLLAVFPRGEKAANNSARDKLKEVNATIAKLHDGKSVFFLDIGEKFLQLDGSIAREIMPDFLHLSPAGYQIWADAIAPKLTELTK